DNARTERDTEPSCWFSSGQEHHLKNAVPWQVLGCSVALTPDFTCASRFQPCLEISLTGGFDPSPRSVSALQLFSIVPAVAVVTFFVAGPLWSMTCSVSHSAGERSSHPVCTTTMSPRDEVALYSH